MISTQTQLRDLCIETSEGRRIWAIWGESRTKMWVTEAAQHLPWPQGQRNSEWLECNSQWADRAAGGSSPARVASTHKGWARGQGEERSGPKGGRGGGTIITMRINPLMWESFPPQNPHPIRNPPYPTRPYILHFIDHRWTEAAFQLSGLYYLQLNPAGKKKKAQTHKPTFPKPPCTPLPSIMDGPGRGSWDNREEGMADRFWLQESSAENTQARSLLPSTSHHRHCALRPQWGIHKKDTHWQISSSDKYMYKIPKQNTSKPNTIIH